LDGLPLRQTHQFRERDARPLAEVALGQAGMFVHFQPAAGGRRRGRLAGTFQREE
jgi:hypothetical protein